ncbi:MAG TPA: hypothetical protein VKV04_11850 [Verrucomicrobiae bacterium]|nr:hypothetical protein [Verrucomicrobiae bacterium]
MDVQTDVVHDFLHGCLLPSIDDESGGSHASQPLNFFVKPYGLDYITHMGIEIHITVPHNIKNVSLEHIVETFQPVDDALGQIFQHYAQEGYEHPSRGWAVRNAEDWQREWNREFYGHVPVAFDAPAGFSFHFGPYALSIHHYARLGRFCTEPPLRQLIRRFTFCVLESVAGERAIYSPDDYGIYDLVSFGKTFAEIEDHLLQNGSPATSFAEFGDPRSRADYHYYIDSFEDFHENGTPVA